MKPPHYAVVAYVKSPVGQFVDELRQELYPEHAHLWAHITILPPRRLQQGSEPATLERLEELCQEVQPFDVFVGDVQSFSPSTYTVFLQVERYAYKVRELHDRLNTSSLCCDEQWPYMPHLTIVKTADAERASQALEIARRRWADYKGPRNIRIEELTFVREGDGGGWVDLAKVRLGRALASQTKGRMTT